jgi:hypothetical protein
MEKRKIILPSLKYENAPEEDQIIRIDLSKKENLLREGDRNIILDISELFDDERNKSNTYKIYGKMRMIFKNVYTGSTTYPPLLKDIYLNGNGSDLDFRGSLPYNEFAFLRTDVFKETSNILSGDNPGSYTPNFTLNPVFTGHTLITPIEAPYVNWNIYLSYVYGQDSNFPITYTLTGGTKINFVSGDGIPFRVTSNGNYYTFTSPVEHGMSLGEYIILSGGSFTSSINVSGKTFLIDSLGNEIFDSEKYVINISKSQISTGTTLNTIMLGKRCTDITNIDETTSKYYVHKHKTLTDINGYILDKLGFESSIFEDEKKLLFQNSEGTEDYLVVKNRMESVLFDFKESFTLTGITNNLVLLPTEVYMTVIFRNGNGYFDYPPKVGYKFHLHDTWIDDHFSGSTANETSLSGNTYVKNGITFTSGMTIPIGTILTGAFVEYNKYELKERIISECLHKITMPSTIYNHDQNTYLNATPDNKIGILYQPHYRVKLRQESPYIETSKTNEIFGLPENVLYDSKNDQWIWRELYDHGYVDPDGYGTDYPFLNNCHYVYSNINFYLINEVLYTNKTDGTSKFKYISKEKLNC